MKLHYKILWIDDQIEDYIEMGIKSEFETYIDSLGFIPTVECFENGALAEKHIKTVKYDLILSDYNIEGIEEDKAKAEDRKEQGNVLISNIRNGGIFTEVLFYSAQPDFDAIAKNLFQDRVSFFSLIGDESFKEFRDKTKKLIDLTIAKLQELNNIRGLVMAETSELDNIVEDILAHFLSKKDDKATTLQTYIVKDCIHQSSKSNLEKAEKMYECDFIEIIKSRLFDADKKARAINKLIQIEKIESLEFANFYNDYKEGVLDRRNDLAHAKSDVIDGIEYLIISRKGEEHSVKFTQEECIEIRKSLRTHSDRLEKLRTIIMVPEAH